MAPPFEIKSVENTGPTDNSGDDSLWVVQLTGPGREREEFRFCVLRRHGIPTPEELRAMIQQRASSFSNYESALDQFREYEVPHPEHSDWRRVIWLAPAGALA
jgi:hypothetical protein